MTNYWRKYPELRVGRLPLWLVRLAYSGGRLLRGLRLWDHHPLADHHGTLSCQPLIMMSSGRSGTTLLRSMLVTGGQIAIPPESHILPYTALQFSALQDLSWDNQMRLVLSLFESITTFTVWETDLQVLYPRLRALPKQERSLARLLDLIYLHYAESAFPQATVWGDQSPNNVLYAPWLAQVYPQGKYLHVLRDGRDVVASYVQKGDSIERATERWRVSVGQAQWLKKHLPSDCFLEVRYEALVSEPETTLQAVCRFSGIDYTRDMLDYWKSPTTVEHKYHTGGYHDNLQKPVFTGSIGRWRERLTDEQQRYVMQQLSQTLLNTDYSA